jgi:outer membrane lipoprotein-sorting protein
MNPNDPRSFTDLVEDNDAASLATVDGLIELHASVPVPGLHFLPPTRRRSNLLQRFGRPLALAAAVAGLALVIGASGLFNGRSGDVVSAQEIVQRATAAAGAGASLSQVQSYHIAATTTVSEMKGTGVMTTETWYAGPDRVRTESRDVSGAVLDGHVIDAPDFWLYVTTPDGRMAVVHGPSDTLSGAVMDRNLPRATSLSDLLDSYKPSDCLGASVAGEETVLGRAAYKIELGGSGNCDAKKAEGKQMTLWVDEQLYLPLRSVQYDVNGDVASTYEVTQLDIDTQIPDSVFGYQPPAGATVLEAATPADAKHALAALFDSTAGSTKDCAPATKDGASPQDSTPGQSCK